MINVVDRVPTKPNRIKLTHEDGSTEYVTWERADEPTVAGTPINKALFDSIRADLPLTGNITRYVSTLGSDSTGDGTQAAPYATIQKAVDSVPKNLGGFSATISIESGTYPEYVIVSNYHGGAMNIGVNAITDVTINGLSVINSHYVSVRVGTFEYNQANIRNNAMISLSYGSLVLINQELVINNVADGSAHSLYVGSGSRLISPTYGITINNSARHAVYVANGIFYSPKISGTNNQRNGIYCAEGGLVMYSESSIASSLGVASASGGRIFGGAQTNVPQY